MNEKYRKYRKKGFFFIFLSHRNNFYWSDFSERKGTMVKIYIFFHCLRVNLIFFSVFFLQIFIFLNLLKAYCDSLSKNFTWTFARTFIIMHRAALFENFELSPENFELFHFFFSPTFFWLWLFFYFFFLTTFLSLFLLF